MHGGVLRGAVQRHCAERVSLGFLAWLYALSVRPSGWRLVYMSVCLPRAKHDPKPIVSLVHRNRPYSNSPQRTHNIYMFGVGPMFGAVCGHPLCYTYLRGGSPTVAAAVDAPGEPGGEAAVDEPGELGGDENEPGEPGGDEVEPGEPGGDEAAADTAVDPVQAAQPSAGDPVPAVEPHVPLCAATVAELKPTETDIRNVHRPFLDAQGLAAARHRIAFGSFSQCRSVDRNTVSIIWWRPEGSQEAQTINFE